MNSLHRELIQELEKVAPGPLMMFEPFNLNRYLGTPRPIYNLTSPQTKSIIRQWIKAHPGLTIDEVRELLDSLFTGATFNERHMGGKLLEALPKLRRKIDPQWLDRWLDDAAGWAEVDSLCQSPFTASEVLENWAQWEKLLCKFVEDKNIHKRRASLVLLTKPVRQSADPRLSDFAFADIEKLKLEKDILITKAVSWLLRSLTVRHAAEVKKYLEENQETLPKIAIWETTRKLLTGKK